LKHTDTARRGDQFDGDAGASLPVDPGGAPAGVLVLWPHDPCLDLPRPLVAAGQAIEPQAIVALVELAASLA
jgi:hypothetical protein